MILMLNLIIAIMSDTYGRYAREKLGLYFVGIIEAMPVYKTDKRYGALVSAVPPFNCLIVPLIPVFLSITDEKKLEMFNNFVCKIIYFPICMLAVTFFMTLNVLFVPFAWIYSLVHKISILVKKPSCFAFLEIFVWLFCGLVFLLIATVPDFFRFISQAYNENSAKVQDSKFSHQISHKAFSNVRKIVHDSHKKGIKHAITIVKNLERRF